MMKGPHRLRLNNTNYRFAVLSRPIEESSCGRGCIHMHTHTHPSSSQQRPAKETDHHSHFPNIPRLIGSGCSTDNDPLFSTAPVINHFCESQEETDVQADVVGDLWTTFGIKCYKLWFYSSQ